MIRIFHSEESQLRELSELQEKPGQWVCVTAPTAEELDLVSFELKIEREALSYALDEDERSRIEINEDDGYTLIILNYPFLRPGSYDTRPVGIFITDRAIVTVCSEQPAFLNDFIEGRVKGFDPCKKGRFLFQISYKVAMLFVTYLRQASKRLETLEEGLKTTTKNEELLRLLDLNNSLIYFSTALMANQAVLQKIASTKPIRIYEEDRELLEDTLIENRQSIEMTNTYINVLSSTMDAYASIISNNLNTVMKFLTSWTIILMLPTLVASFYGMNVNLPFQRSEEAFLIVMGTCVLLIVTLLVVMKKKKYL